MSEQTLEDAINEMLVSFANRFPGYHFIMVSATKNLADQDVRINGYSSANDDTIAIILGIIVREMAAKRAGEIPTTQ